ncbi:DUF1338 domain-containing protein [Gynuella sp.]|uniref:DUF1338 domain-containing protein n=1 Tax=Gynuella sp. TaxID=2969146 RepID=UPI003D0F596B
MNITEFFVNLWNDYVRMTPQADAIQQAFQQRGDQVINDHVAFRTFKHSAIELEKIEPFLFDLGYQRNEQYHFSAKKLNAWSYIHQNEDQPLIFLSELLTDQLSAPAQKIIRSLTDQIDPGTITDASVFYSGRHWQCPDYQTYQSLLAESEYAAWLSVFGLRANHFTVAVHKLKSLQTLPEVNDFVESLDYELNTTGAKIKGSPEVLLEQSSTMASHQDITFGDGSIHQIPTCFYEFARRYPQADGSMFKGFVEANADKIFDSTNARR